MISLRLQNESLMGAAICWDLNYLICWAIAGKILGLNGWQNCVSRKMTEKDAVNLKEISDSISWIISQRKTGSLNPASYLLKINYSMLFIKMQSWSIAFCSMPPH